MSQLDRDPQGAQRGDQAGRPLSVYGRMPLLPSEREYGTLGANGTCFAYAIATWAFLTGGFAAQLVGAWQGMVCLIAGNLIGVFLISAPLSMSCQRYGIEQVDACKPSFGQNGAKIILVFYLANMLGWSGLILVMFGNGIKNIVQTLGYDPGQWLVGAGVALGIWLSYLLTTRGVHLLNRFNSIITPALIIIVAFMFYMLISNFGWSEIMSAEPLDPLPVAWMNYAVTLELGIASGMSWWGGIGFLARNTKTRRNAIYPEVLQLGLVFGVVCSIALFSGLVVGSDDPTQWMVPLGGAVMGILALVFVALANITSTSVSLFASGLALRHLPGLHKRAWWQIIVITIIPLTFFIVWPQQLFDLGDAFLAYNGTMHAPVGGVLLVDYFFLKKQRLHLASIFEAAPSGRYYYSNGFNVLALACVVIGQITYFWVYNPFTDVSHALFRYCPASVAAFVLPAAIYYIGMKFWVYQQLKTGDSTNKAESYKVLDPNI